MFESVLIANRGEIALRILRACKTLGIRTIAVYSEADRNLLHVRHADQAICLGPAPSLESYLNVDRLMTAARLTGAQAIHPGYGFLSENAAFAATVEAAGLTFVGPTSTLISNMGDKISAKRLMHEAGVPCVPGYDGALPDDATAVQQIAASIGYPLMVKAAGGGGGRGMRVVRSSSELDDAISLTREEARRFFGNPSIYLERFLEHPRHIEIQVLADTHGNAVWLGERDCSMQRRNQKLIEESPAPGIDRQAIHSLGERCAQACTKIGYRGAGTFEFLYEDGEFFFIEMNTRIQVEHPVSELTTGVDLVEQQLRIARGEVLSLVQSEIQFSGHAIECRINAEDPWKFSPSPGIVTTWIAPGGPGVRVDSHLYSGYEIPAYYDSLVAKLITYGTDRAQAVNRMRSALFEMRADGVRTNAPLLSALMDDPGFVEGSVNIHYLERRLADGLAQGRG